MLALGRKLGFGRRRGGKFKRGMRKKLIFVENKITGETRKLGTKADFEKDVKEVAKEAFTETLEKDHGKGKKVCERSI